MINAGDISCKSSRANGVGRDIFLPKVEVYRLNLVCNLYSWLPESFEIFTEAKIYSEKKDLSVDIVLLSKKRTYSTRVSRSYRKNRCSRTY